MTILRAATTGTIFAVVFATLLSVGIRTADASKFANVKEAQAAVKVVQQAGYSRDVSECAIELIYYRIRCEGIKIDATNSVQATLSSANACQIQKATDREGFDDVVWLWRNAVDAPC